MAISPMAPIVLAAKATALIHKSWVRMLLRAIRSRAI